MQHFIITSFPSSAGPSLFSPAPVSFRHPYLPLPPLPPPLTGRPSPSLSGVRQSDVITPGRVAALQGADAERGPPAPMKLVGQLPRHRSGPGAGTQRRVQRTVRAGALVGRKAWGVRGAGGVGRSGESTGLSTPGLWWGREGGGGVRVAKVRSGQRHCDWLRSLT